MAEEPGASPAKPGKESFLKKKVAGIPMPVVLIVGGIAVFYLYSKYKANQSSTSSTATPTASTTTSPDTSGGYTGGGGYSGGGGTTSGGAIDPLTGLPYQAGVGSLAPTVNQSPTDTSQFTPAPPASLATRNGSLTISQAQARVAGSQKDVNAAKAEVAAAKGAAAKKAAQAKLTSAQNALKSQTATLNKLKAAA